MENRQEAAMYHHMNDWNGWDWFWMVPMMLLWIVVLGGVVYAAVRLALQHSERPPIPPVHQ
ncbi:MAG TPA: hypothetical protein VFU10_08370 [Gaiellaceae bacterium]|nr:hypothetical protein [Gaiellaceae bacterium]